MRTLIVAHGDQRVFNSAAEFINAAGLKSVFFLKARPGTLVDLDTVRDHLKEVEALILMQCKTSSEKPKYEHETELQRVEWRSAAEAHDAGVVVVLVGTLSTLLAKHMQPDMRRHYVDLAVITERIAPDRTGGISDSFTCETMEVRDLPSEALKVRSAIEKVLQKRALRVA